MTGLVGLVIGAALGGGAVVVGRALRARPTSAVVTLERLGRTGVSVADIESGARSSWSDSVLARLGKPLVGDITSHLSVLDRSIERHAVERMTVAIALGGIPIALGLGLVLGGVAAPAGMLLLASVAGAVIGVVVPDLTVRSQATARRRAFRHALSSYLDLVNVLLAGGAGVETALEAAAESGDGWAFQRIRDALTRSRSLRTTPWECFAELGRRDGIAELVELAASVQLAGQHGARIRLSLVAKAAALRAHDMSRVEADAQAATERMGLPTVLMFVGFLVLLGYPAVQLIIGGFGG